MTELEISDAVDAYVQRKSVGDPDGSGAGTYVSNAESILHRWADWLEREHEIGSLFDLDVEHMHAYGVELRTRTDAGTYTASTARTYFAVVRAFLSWCVRGGILETNPAATQAATAALPIDEERSSDECWTTEQRRSLEDYLQKRVLDAEEGSRSERVARLREYAMVSVLAHSPVRGSELFRVPDDERRSGATWADVDFYTGTIRVLGKSQRLEEVPVPAAARTPLRRYRVVLDPPSNEWPLFPTRHAPSIARRVREVLAERGHTDEEIDLFFEGETAVQLTRKHSITPPAITTEGARSILKRLCGHAEIDVDGDYLKPRGAQRRTNESPVRRDATATGTSLRETLHEQSIVLVDQKRAGEAESERPGPD